MVNEKVIGAGLIIASILACLLYGVWLFIGPIFLDAGYESIFLGEWKFLWGFFPMPPLYWAIVIPLYASLLIISVIFGWIGSALIKSPSPPEISAEEIEEELEEAEETTTPESSTKE